MSQYLYGASVQGIQSFIFETNKLKEIAGASELVDHICTVLFQKSVGASYNPKNLLIGASGNIKYLFDNHESCQALVRTFPRKVIRLAPGVTISQAVVKIQEEFDQKHVQLLEARLKTQRNRPPVQHGLGLMISERSRRTGKPGVEWSKDGAIDAAQQAKRNFTGDSTVSLLKKLVPDTKGRGYHKLFPMEMEDIAGGKDKKNWVAVIHADGNDLGKKIMRMAQDGPDKEAFRELSERIGSATEQAARLAFDEVVRQNTSGGDLFPFRPILLGGDDLTVIIRGDLAVDFTNAFLKAFEEKTASKFEGFVSAHFHGGLTACAGIAYIKSNYPFHYGVRLADALCAQAKKAAKGMKYERTPSCLLFHKVHSSFIEDYRSIIEQEFTIKSEDPKEDDQIHHKDQSTEKPIRLDFGPYFLTPQAEYATIDQLKIWVKALNEKASPKSRLRNWLSELQVNKQAAAQELDRIKVITNKRYIRELKLDDIFKPRTEKGQNGKQDEAFDHTHLFDALTLSSIETNRK